MIRLRIVIASSIAGLALFAVAPSFAAIVMDFPDHPALTDHVQVASYAFQRSAPPLAKQCTGAGGGGSFTITKPVDAQSPQLAEASRSKGGAQVLLDDTKADGKRVAFRFTDATISSIKPAAGGDQPMESIAFTYSKIQWVTVGCAPPPAAPARRDIPSPSPSHGGGGYGTRY
jgi:hypothetical protein